MWVWIGLNDWPVQNKSLRKHCIQKWHIAVKYLYPCFLTTLVISKYFEVHLGQSSAYKPRFALKTPLSQNMVHFTWRTNSPLTDPVYPWLFYKQPLYLFNHSVSQPIPPDLHCLCNQVAVVDHVSSMWLKRCVYVSADKIVELVWYHNLKIPFNPESYFCQWVWSIIPLFRSK